MLPAGRSETAGKLRSWGNPGMTVSSASRSEGISKMERSGRKVVRLGDEGKFPTAKADGVPSAVGGVVDGDEFDEQVLHEFERNLIRTVRHRVGGIGVGFHEHTLDAGGHCGAG